MRKEQSILITGCSSGIGYSAATILHERGYRVFATARKAKDVQRLSDEGLTALQLDLTNPASITHAVQQVLDATGGTLDALFNNGAYGQPGAVEDLPTNVLREQFETNLFGWHELTRQVIPVMRKQGHGRIVQNSSVLGLIALPFRGAYNSSKYAIEGLTDTLRMELHGSGIHVSLIEPGPIESRFRANAYAKFQEHITIEGSAFEQQYRGAEKRLKKEGPAAPFTLPADAVVKKLIHALEAKKPRARYYVTFPTYLFGTLRRMVSTGVMDRILRGVSSGENR
jgi:NAD(P)-dependent dehydrogenase (short-subunit alcohol dehydrogenase family)